MNQALKVGGYALTKQHEIEKECSSVKIWNRKKAKNFCSFSKKKLY